MVDFGKALLEYRNTPRIDGLNPSQWYMGRRQRTSVVVNPKAYERIPNKVLNEYLEKREATYAKVKDRCSKKEINDEKFKPGTKVIVQNPKTKRWDHPAVIINQRSKRSYLFDDGTQRFKLA